jgi:uncharacterized membrane protein YcjF (UPF0283 family)
MLKDFVQAAVDGPMGIRDEFGRQDWVKTAGSLVGTLAYAAVIQMAFQKFRGY